MGSVNLGGLGEAIFLTMGHLGQVREVIVNFLHRKGVGLYNPGNSFQLDDSMKMHTWCFHMARVGDSCHCLICLKMWDNQIRIETDTLSVTHVASHVVKRIVCKQKIF